jgi:type I restriction enzyme, S subunit
MANSIIRTLNDVCELIVDCEHKTAPVQTEGHPSIRTPNIGRGRLILDDVNRVSEETYKIWTRRAVPKEGDLILAREAPVGNVAIVPRNLRICLGQRTVLIRADKAKIDHNYLLYLLLSDTVQGRIVSIANGATVGHLNVRDLRGLELPELLAPSAQRKVAAILSAYDDLTENNTRRIKILEEMARTIYSEWFVNFRFPGHEKVKVNKSKLGPFPDSWVVKKLGDIAQETRRSVNPSEIDPKTPYVGLEHIPRKSIALSKWGTAGEVQSTKLAFRKGEILFGKIRPYFHKVAVAPLDGVCSTDTIIISPKAPQHFALVLSCVSSEEFVNHATQTSQGTKMPRANWNVLVNYPVALPPPDLYQQFDRLVLDIVNQIQNSVFRIRNLQSTRDLLLPKLLSGELEVEKLDVAISDIEQTAETMQIASTTP